MPARVYLFKYLSFPDALMDLAEQRPPKPDAQKLAELAHSFSHDILGLGVLAGRTLWYEAVSPDMSRPPDVVSVSVDVENYFVLLQTACDIMAETVRGRNIVIAGASNRRIEFWRSTACLASAYAQFIGRMD